MDRKEKLLTFLEFYSTQNTQNKKTNAVNINAVNIFDEPNLTKKIGWICTYVPEELIIASGFVPFRITGKEKISKAESFFPINYCPFIKSSMEELLKFKSKLSGIIFTNSCDGMRRFYDICKKYLPDLPSFMLDVPRVVTKHSIKHYENNLLLLIDFLNRINTNNNDNNTNDNDYDNNDNSNNSSKLNNTNNANKTSNAKDANYANSTNNTRNTKDTKDINDNKKNNETYLKPNLNEIITKSLNENLIEALKITENKRNLLNRLRKYFISFQSEIGIKNYFNILHLSVVLESHFFNVELEKYLNYIEYNIKSNLQKSTSFGQSKTDKSNNIFENSILDKDKNVPNIMVIGNFLDEERLWEIFEELNCNILYEDCCNSTRYFKFNLNFNNNFNSNNYNFNSKSNIDNTDNTNNTITTAAITTTAAATTAAATTTNNNNTNDYINDNFNDKTNDNFSILINNIAVRQLNKSPCMRMANLDIKIKEILDNIKKNNIDGIVFVSQKFCDNTLLFYPLLRQELLKINKQSLFLEIEHNNISSGQIKTRLQAFLEII